MTISHKGKQLKLELPRCRVVPVSWLETWAEAVPSALWYFPFAVTLVLGSCRAERFRREVECWVKLGNVNFVM